MSIAKNEKTIGKSAGMNLDKESIELRMRTDVMKPIRAAVYNEIKYLSSVGEFCLITM
jgi:hypothetical protein